MANQTVSTNSNHDDLTGRAAGEDFTITSDAILTIDSMPHLTSMGILGDITITAGTLIIDGSRTFEVVYSGGSGSLPSIGTAITWNGGNDSGKIIRFNSGDNVSGVLTLTVNTGDTTPDDTDSITDGSWAANLDSVAVGFLIVYGEDQDWGSVDGQSSLIITGDWYEVYVGNGLDDQTFELPHTGHQPALWVETGSGTGVFEIWHRVSPYVGTIYYNDISQFGNTFESGFVFDQTFGDATVTFGDATNGGVVPNGARVRIPNVHLGTTTTGAPTTEVNSASVASHIGVIAPNTNLNVSIDHLNGSSVYIDFRGTNEVTCSDSCWGISTNAALINKVNAQVTISNCFIGAGSTSDYACANATAKTIIDNVGGITFEDVVMYSGTNSNNQGVLMLTTMSNMEFLGRCKIVSNQQDENTMATIRGSVATNVSIEAIISLGGAIYATAGCNDWVIDELIYGLPPGRGTAEQNSNILNLTGTQNFIVNSGSLATGGAKHSTIGLFLLTDAFNTTIRNFGDVESKIDGENRLTYVASIAGITSNALFQRLWYTNLNTAQSFQMINSSANITIENCSGDYNDEIETDANRVLIKGLHGGSGNPNTSTGVEGDNVNCIASIFLDYFKSDTTGALGLTFQDRGVFHATDVEIVSGTPIWNGLGDLLMRNTGDQVIYTWPYSIKGHTAFQNAAIETSGTVSNLEFEYAVDTGSGFGSWKTANGTNLSSESISPSGFGFKFRITATSDLSGSTINGLAILTNTTLADQANNLYPLNTVPITIVVKDADTDDPIENARVRIVATSGGPAPVNQVILSGITNASGVLSTTTEYTGQPILCKIRRATPAYGTLYKPVRITTSISTSGLDLSVPMIPDE